MAFEGYFPKFTLASGKTDDRKGDGFGMIVNGVSMMADTFEGSEATDRLLDWFLSKGVTTVDIVVIQHWHGDHYGGGVKMVESGKIKFKTVYAIDPLTYSHGVDGSDNGRAVQQDMDNAYKAVRIFQAHGSRVLWKDHGDSIQVGDIHWDIFRKQPTEFTEYDDGNAYAFINDGSLILYSPELMHMICSDGPCDQKDAIHYFQKKYGKKDILRCTSVTHHGGSYSRLNAEAFVDAGGIFAYESCIERNGPGTTDWTLYGARRLVQAGATVWMQDEDIIFTAAGGRMTIRQGGKTITYAVPYSTKVQEGWVKNAKGWWYKNSDGSYCVGWAKRHWGKGGKTYSWFYFNKQGYMVTGWLLDPDRNAWFYLDPTTGAMWALKWLTYKGKQCYFKLSGRAYQNETVVIDGKICRFDKNCYLVEETSPQGDTDTELDGCDVASYQSTIEPSKMTTTDFFIVKATQGTWYVNPYSDIQYYKAKEAGKLLGMYHYAEGGDPVKEAQYFINKVGGRVGECVLAVDWEGNDNGRFNTAVEVEWVRKFANEVYRLTKVHIFLYCSKGVTRRRNWSDVAVDVRLWCAQYANNNNTDYKSDPWTDDGGFGAWYGDTIRQYSSKGRVTGYDKNLDLNKAYLSRKLWRKYAMGDREGTEVAETKPVNTQWSSYIYETGDTVKISNSGSDENGNYSGGKAGDQTGKEWYIRNWYDRPWYCVLRHPLAEVRACIATLAVKAAENNQIGYDQGNRDSYGKELAKVGYDPSKITTAVESDCSKGVIDNVKAAGYILGMDELASVKSTYTGNMRELFQDAGFIALTNSRYITGSDYLMAGDILLNDKSHTATVVTNGPKANEQIVMPLLKRDSGGTSVRQLQIWLNKVEYSGKKKLEVNGSFDLSTQAQVIFYQASKKIDADGEVGPITWGKLLEDIL